MVFVGCASECESTGIDRFSGAALLQGSGQGHARNEGTSAAVFAVQGADDAQGTGTAFAYTNTINFLSCFERWCMKSLTFLMRVVVPLALLSDTGMVGAQNYPTKALRMVVPFAPGGPNDILARLVGQKLTEQWGQAVLIENRGGAGGTVGLEAASRLPGDGYVLAMGGTSNLAVAPSLYANLPYDSIKDFTPIINVAIVPYALAINPTVPAKNVKELIAVAGRKQGYLSYGSSGMGSISSLAAEMLKSMSKTDIVHVPYKGTAPALTDVVRGQIDLMLADFALIQPYASAGRLRVIGVTGSKRSTAARDVPTIAESAARL